MMFMVGTKLAFRLSILCLFLLVLPVLVCASVKIGYEDSPFSHTILDSSDELSGHVGDSSMAGDAEVNAVYDMPVGNDLFDVSSGTSDAVSSFGTGRVIKFADKGGDAVKVADKVSDAGKVVRAKLEKDVAKKGGDFFKKGDVFDVERNVNKNEPFVRELPDGRIRNYEKLRKSDKTGPTLGARNVDEIDPFSGKTIRNWEENYNSAGDVVQVHPKSPTELPHMRIDSITGKVTERWYYDPITNKKVYVK